MAETDPATLATGLKAASPIVLKAIGQAVDMIKSLHQSVSDRAIRELRIGYSDFLISSFNRCQQVKTILTGDHPIALLEVYQNLNLSCNENIIEDIDLIQNLEDYKRIVISGTGGAGKSMLMKYLTVSRFENCRGKIPLFVELRNLNNISSKDILPFCFANCSTAKNRVTYSNFEKVFSVGGFILILDGFDEIDADFKDYVESQILEIGRKYPDCTIVLSSRIDSRFKGWQDYHVFEMCKLNQNQVSALIKKVKCDTGVKKRFLKELPSLWGTHETFLSIPLLSVIMLLTFGKFSEISPKATLFYKLAFQTLFREHDANKEQFRRPMHTDLELDDFERAFAAFCAISYLDNKISFDKTAAHKFTNDAMKYARLKVDPETFVRDLIENVCMLQQEGVEITFVHRSFQEYFTSVFLTSYHEGNIYEVVEKVADRENDSTLQMFKELDETKFEIFWLLPTLDSMIDDLNNRLKTGSSIDILGWMFIGLIFDHNLKVTAATIAPNSRIPAIRQIEKIYPKEMNPLSVGNVFRALQHENYRKLWGSMKSDRRQSIKNLLKSVSVDRPRLSNSLVLSAKDKDWLDQTNIVKVFTEMRDELVKIRERINSERASQSSIIFVGGS